MSSPKLVWSNLSELVRVSIGRNPAKIDEKPPAQTSESSVTQPRMDRFRSHLVQVVTNVLHAFKVKRSKLKAAQWQHRPISKKCELISQ